MGRDPTPRNVALSHWVVVFLPGDYCATVPLTYDDGAQVLTAEDAIERAWAAIEADVRDGARDGAAEPEELEALIFERGTEACRFYFEPRWERYDSLPAARDWRPDEAAAARLRGELAKREQRIAAATDACNGAFDE